MSNRALSRQLETLLPSGLAIGLLLIVWETIGRVWDTAFLPPFSSVLQAGLGLILSGQIQQNIAASLSGLAVGFGLAVVDGLILGILIGRSRKSEYFFDPYILALLASPPLIFVPVLYSLFGVSRLIQIAMIFLSAFPSIVISTSNAMRWAEADHIEMARSFGANQIQILRQVLLPGAVPLVMAGLRVGLGRGIIGMVNGEMIVTLTGLGTLIRRYGDRLEADKVFAVLLVVIVLSMALSSVLHVIDRRLTSWMPSTV